MAVGDVYECTAEHGLNVRQGPSTNTTIIGGISKGARVKEIAIEGNWLKHAAGYSSLQYLKKVASATVNTSTTNSTASTTSQQTINEESGLNSDGSAGASYDPNTLTNGSAVKEFSNSLGETFKEVDSMIGTFGIPYQFLPLTDPRTNGANPVSTNGADTGMGFEYGSKIASKIPLLFIAPGRPNFMTKFSSDEKSTVLTRILNEFRVSSDQVKLDDLLESEGRYYTFDYALSEYYSYVNPMCRIAARYLELEDIKLGSYYLDNVDWSEYTIDHIRGLMESTTYMNIPFYLDSDASVSEDFDNSIGESSLASSVNGISDLGRELNFLTGYSSSALNQDWFSQNADTLENIENINQEIESILGKGNFLSNLTKHLNTVASGGRLIFPKIWTDSGVGRSFNVKIKLVAPDCNKLSVYLNILVPLFHLIGLVAPQTIPSNPNGYTAPFIVRAMYKSFFNVDMGIITSMSIDRGGNCMWTVDGLPTSVEVSLTIKDLYETMSITKTSSTEWRYDTMSNTAQMDYIANLCGINMYKPEIGRQISMWLVNNIENRALDIPRNIWRDINQGIGSTVLSIFRRGF